MFVYLSKKIAIPNNIRLTCVTWNKVEGSIAIGGDNGFLKVLKLEEASVITNGIHAAVASASHSNLSMGQALEGHKGQVQIVNWNESQQKLITSDHSGIIMGWMLYKGSWHEEMTNDRKKCPVRGMEWSSDGEKICIVYEDGTIILGYNDGSRIWAKELKNTLLTGVQWSPDNRLLLFSIANGECHLYDNQGTFVMKLNIKCLPLTPTRSTSAVSLSWYNGKNLFNRPVLCICYANGQIIIMRNELDEKPIIINTEMQNVSALWNCDGNILSVCGIKRDFSGKDSNQVIFYTPHGIHLRSLKIPGREITCQSWEKQSLRLALTVDSYIYFATIHPDYLWCYFEKTVVFPNDINTRITFWNTISNQNFVKEIDLLLGLASYNEYCVIAVENLKLDSKENSALLDTNFNNRSYQLLICNLIGTTVDATYTDLRPHFVAMNSTYVVIASPNEFFLWHYQTPKKSLQKSKSCKDKRFHIDDTSSGLAEVLNDLDRNRCESYTNNFETKDPICCVAISEKIILIARDSGVIHEYNIPSVVLGIRYKISGKAYKMAINCNSTRAAIIDSTGVMTILNIEENMTNKATTNRVERKDVWVICWAKENPELLALMEKSRMYVLRGPDPEEPIPCSGHICSFEDLEITTLLLDDIMGAPETISFQKHIKQLKIKSLRDTIDLLAHVGTTEAKQFIMDNPHPRLWRLLAEASLKKLDLENAENAFVRCTDYSGIQLIKYLKSITSENLKNAEISAFYGNFEDAESFYIDADRRDLAIKLRSTLHDYFRTVQMYKMGPGISDQQMESGWRNIGDYFANTKNWMSAMEYYEKAHCMDGFINSSYYLEDFENLKNCVKKLPEKTQLLAELAQKLSSFGMCNEAVAAYLKLGDYKSAVNICVNLRQWGEAVELAQRYKMPQIGVLLTKHATYLLQEGKLPEVIALQKKAGRYLDAVHLLSILAEREVVKKSNLLRIKKLYVLAGMLTEEYLKSQSSVTGFNRSNVLAELSPDVINLLNKIWRNAEAYHFMLLVQQQLRQGNIHNAVITAHRLKEYDDILKIEDVYSLLALASYADKSFGTCSKAFIKLESLEYLSKNILESYDELAVNIFSKNAPYDNKTNTLSCFNCNNLILDWMLSCFSCGYNFPVCIASGKSLITCSDLDVWICNFCFHFASTIEISNRRVCPLCHNLII